MVSLRIDKSKLSSANVLMVQGGSVFLAQLHWKCVFRSCLVSVHSDQSIYADSLKDLEEVLQNRI